MPAIQAKSLTKSFQSGRRKTRRVVDAVRGIDLLVEHGERIAYIGPNGAGKSTSIKMFTGILTPTSGELSVLDLAPSRQRRALAQRIGVLFGQRSQLWSELTARESLTLLGAIYRVDRSELPRRIAEVVDLLDGRELLDQQVRSFSLGQRMRCELAASLLHEPRMLFLDEPTIGLDLVAKQLFRELVHRVNIERETTIFLTSHDVSDIEAVAERVVVINHGVVIYDDSVTELRRSLLSTKSVDVRFGHETVVMPPDGVAVVESTSETCELRVDTAVCSIRQTLDWLLDRYDVIDISVVDPPLEEVIGEIYAGRL